MQIKRSTHGPVQVLSFLLWGSALLSCRAAEPYPDIMPIGEIQGEMNLEIEPSRFRSDFLRETVKIQGVIHQILRWETGSGEAVYALLLQNTPEESDRNPKTSDGMFVYTGRYPSLPKQGSGEYQVQVGHRVVLRGEVNERYGQTELSDAVVLEVEEGDFLEEVEVRTLSVLPDRVWDRDWIFETLEGMRVQVPEGGVTVSGTHPNSRTGDQNLWVAPASNPVADRTDPAARRLYRPLHPMSSFEKGTLEEHGNVVVIGHLGDVERRKNPEQVAMPMVHAGSEIVEEMTGGIIYFWGEYLLQPERLPKVIDVGPAESSLPADPSSEQALRIASYNVENLYDFQNDPFDGCDFAGDDGCPDVRRPFNYVPDSDEVYDLRLDAIAKQIVAELDSPDLLLIQEVEDQDIGVMTEAGMVYTNKNDADGEVDALQELAIRIVARGGPVYRIAIDRDGADVRGITCAWMYNPLKVRAASPGSWHPLLTATPDLPEGLRWLPMSYEASNPKAFNVEFQGVDNEAALTEVFSRPVQVLQVERVSDEQTVYLLNNHFSSGPNRRVERRRMQARVNAELATKLLEENPEAWVIAGGDLNVFPRPDDPLDPPSDQLGSLYDAGLFNVYDRVISERPAEAYSYIYKGVVNTLDHLFLSPAATSALEYAGYLKLNAGAPESMPGDPPLRASDHDPVVVELR